MSRQQVKDADLGRDVARANLLTNGGFEVWQRGSSFNTPGVVGPDRWTLQIAGTDTLSVAKNVASPDIGSNACASLTFTLGTGAGLTGMYQLLRPSDGYQLKGATFSFSLRALTAVPGQIRIAMYSDGTAPPATAYSAFHPGNNAYRTLTATFGPVPADATYLAVVVYMAASGIAYVDNAAITRGAVAADYVPLHPADDLARCLRYYEKHGPGPIFPGFILYQQAGGSVGQSMEFAAKKATTPSLTPGGTFAIGNVTGGLLLSPTLGDGYFMYGVATATAQTYIQSNNGGYIVAESNP